VIAGDGAAKGCKRDENDAALMRQYFCGSIFIFAANWF